MSGEAAAGSARRVKIGIIRQAGPARVHVRLIAAAPDGERPDIGPGRSGEHWSGHVEWSVTLALLASRDGRAGRGGAGRCCPPPSPTPSPSGRCGRPGSSPGRQPARPASWQSIVTGVMCGLGYLRSPGTRTPPSQLVPLPQRSGPAHPPRSCRARLGPLSEVNTTFT